MIETFMFFALGFLAACLLVLPIVHSRAVRLTMRRIETSVPISIAADKRRLRAEVAKLNTDLDERSRTADGQRIEIVALKIQIDTLKDEVDDLGKRRALGPLDPERRAIMRLVH